MKTMEQLTITDGDEILAVPCIEIVALTTTGRDQEPGGMAAFFSACRDRFEADWVFARTADSRRTRKIKPDDLELIPFWFEDERSLKETMIGLRLNAGEDKDHWDVPSFQFYFNHVEKKFPRGLFRICLPVDYVTNSEKDFADLLQELMAEFPLAWGFAGYSFYWNTLLDDIESRVREPMANMLKRHHGFSYGDTGFYLTEVEKGLGNISWITMLGKDQVETLGGVDTVLEQTKDTEVGLIEFGNGGIGLQAGKMPATGDVNRNEKLLTQLLVGEIVDPVRITDEAIDNFVYIDGFEIEDAQTWFKRFFKP